MECCDLNIPATVSMSLLSETATSDQMNEALRAINDRKMALIEDIERIKAEIRSCSDELDILESTSFNELIGVDNGLYNEIPNDGHTQLRSRLVAQSIKRFNAEPRNGIEYMIQSQILSADPKEIAEFLLHGSVGSGSNTGLSKVAIGNYLGEKDDQSINVLNEFTKLQDFQGINVVEALRRFLYTFRLPGEGQKIDRMIQSFAEQYHSCNPNVFSEAENVHVLSYAIVMLNTSLHNKNAAKSGKFGLDDFVKMVENGLHVKIPTMTGQNFTATTSEQQHAIVSTQNNNDSAMPDFRMLQAIFDSVRRQPFKLPDDELNSGLGASALSEIFFNSDIEGWLYKQGGNFKSWKRRWFILAGCCLYYFEYTTDKKPRGIISLSGGLSVRSVEDNARDHCFEVFAVVSGNRIRTRKTTDRNRQEANHSSYRFSAPSEREKGRWMRCLAGTVENISIEGQF